MKKHYEVTVKVLVAAPPSHVRSVEKLVHALVQEELPGYEGNGLEILGASVVEGQTKVFDSKTAVEDSNVDPGEHT